MKKIICTTLLLFQFFPNFSQVVINEVMIKPGPDATSSLYQSLKMCSSSTSGSEYIELYNADPCNSVDISCYIIGFNIFTSQSHGTFRFPAGSVIPPLGFLSIGGPNSGATINLFNYCSTPNLNTGNDRWYLENGDGYIILYNPTGAVVDAVYWTFSAGQANKWGTDSDISNAPTLIASGSGCPVVASLPGPSSIPIGSASYAGQGPNTGTVIERTTDGSSTWATNAAPTINSCNGICITPSSFELNATIVQPSCGNDNGSISFAPSPSGTYFYTWPFPSNWTVSSVNNLAPGTYPVTITNDLGCSIDTIIQLQDIPCGNSCDPNGNLIIYSNYDGGILTINVDQNIPNLKVGICTYEPIQVTFTGAFVANITQVIYAGMNSNQNNNNCGLGNFTTSISGVPSGIVTISPPMNPPPVGYTPAHGNGSGPWGGGMIGVAGLCDTTVSAGGGNTPDEVVYYFQNTTSGTLLFHQTQYACWTNQTVNISAGGNCCILPPNSNPCTPPSVPEITTAAATCAAAGTATILNYSGSLTYTFSPNGLTAGAGGVILGMTPGTSYTVTASNGSCSSSASLSFNVAPQLATPNAPTAGVTTQPTCTVPTAIVTVTAPSPAVGTTYTITGTAPVVGPQTNTSGVFGGLTPGTYDVTTTVGGCTSTATVLIVSTPSGAPTISVVSSNDVTCNGGNDGDAAVSGSGGTGTLTYNWTPGNLSGASQTGLSAGSYTVQVTDQSGCSNSAIVTIGEPAAININETITPTNCGSADGSISLVATGGTGTLNYSWTPGGSASSSVTGLIPGNYSVLVTDQSGCTATENYVLGQAGSLAIDATPEITTITAGESVQFNTTGGSTYTWSPSSSLDCADCPNPIATPSTSTMYIVTGTDASGCSGVDTVYVNVVPVPIECGDIFVPTVFSPNGTGNTANKTICVYGSCVAEITFAIYNRWGERVFETSDVNLTECWDGTFKGKSLNSGSFVYKLIVTLVNNEVIEESGNITLIR